MFAGFLPLVPVTPKESTPGSAFFVFIGAQGFGAFFTFSLMFQVSSALMASLLIGARHVPSNHESETPRRPS